MLRAARPARRSQCGNSSLRRGMRRRYDGLAEGWHDAGMRWIVAPLVSRTHYTGACHVLAGIPLAAPFLVVAAVTVAVARTLLPAPGAAAAGIATGVLAVGLAGGVRPVRTGSAVLARALLGVDLPVPG